jgi:tripartite-type tricarboxylate transporter receptor subunit TctC
VNLLNRNIVAVLKSADVRERLLAQSAEPVGDRPEEFGAFVKSEYVKWAKVAREANIRAE